MLTSLIRNFDIKDIFEIIYYIVNIIGAIPFLQIINRWLKKLNRKHMELTCIVLNETKITSDYSTYGLKTMYNDTIIKRFTITKITFWNDSLHLLHYNKLTKPFSFIVNGGNILSYKIVAGDNPEHEHRIGANSINESTVEITFNVLKHHEGGIIEICHTGAEDSVSISEEIDKIEINTIVVQGKKLKENRLVSMITFSLIFIIISMLIYILKIDVIIKMLVGIIIVNIFVVVYIILSNGKKKNFIPTNCK